MPIHDNIEHINYTSVDDLIGKSPNWLLRSGIAIIAMVTLLVLLLSSLISYPDKITAKGIMTSTRPPITHVCPTSAIIEDIYVHNGDRVKENDTIIYLKNTTSRADLEELIMFVDAYKQVDDMSYFLKLSFPEQLRLGELQRSYSELQLLYANFLKTLRQSGVFRQINTIQHEIEDTKTLRSILKAEKEFTKEELSLIEKDFHRNSVLNQEGVISDVERERVESEWIRYQKQYGNLDKGIVQNKIREGQLVLESQRLQEERASLVQSHLNDIERVLHNLRFEIEAWKKKYYLMAENEGMVAIQSDIAEDQYISQGRPILSIIPTGAHQKLQIKAMTYGAGIGKINIGDKVIVKVDGYPYKEYGVLIESVDEISALPESKKIDGGESLVYPITINIPDTLRTNYDNIIDYRPNATVTVEIITNDKSMIERLFESFLSLI